MLALWGGSVLHVTPVLLRPLTYLFEIRRYFLNLRWEFGLYGRQSSGNKEYRHCFCIHNMSSGNVELRMNKQNYDRWSLSTKEQKGTYN